MWVRIRPLDVLLFRDSRPFAAGESFRAASVPFPPGPLPFVGALRTQVLARALAAQGLGFAEYGAACRRPGAAPPALAPILERFGTPRELGRLRFRGPFVVHPRHGAGVPAPLDVRLGRGEAGSSGGPVFLVPAAPRNPAARSRGPVLQGLRATDALGEEAAGLFAGLTNLSGYLEGRSAFFFAEGEVVAAEPRTGIALGPGRTAAEGHLYTVEYLRLAEGASFLVQAEGLEPGDLPSGGLLQLGGEARAASYEVLDGPAAPRVPEPPPLAGWKRFKVALLAPGIHREGWLPDFVTPGDGGFFCDLGGGERARLVSAAVGRPSHVGGWDLVAGAPRPMLRAAPAGSVYFFEAERALSAEAASNLARRLHWQSSMEPTVGSLRQLYRQAGFGLSVVGSWGRKEDT
jgi:CRISPR-associated protein Cmr3